MALVSHTHTRKAVHVLVDVIYMTAVRMEKTAYSVSAMWSKAGESMLMVNIASNVRCWSVVVDERPVATEGKLEIFIGRDVMKCETLHYCTVSK